MCHRCLLGTAASVSIYAGSGVRKQRSAITVSMTGPRHSTLWSYIQRGRKSAEPCFRRLWQTFHSLIWCATRWRAGTSGKPLFPSATCLRRRRRQRKESASDSCPRQPHKREDKRRTAQGRVHKLRPSHGMAPTPRPTVAEGRIVGRGPVRRPLQRDGVLREFHFSRRLSRHPNNVGPRSG